MLAQRAVAVLMLTAASPFLLVIGALIKLSSPGPIIFRQMRVGRNGRKFVMYKFRTMFVGTAERASHLTDSSSVTPLGSLLRRLKLDELPQLYNVARGDMNFIGPRPCLPSQEDVISARIQHGAFNTTPGITGLAQVRGVDMSSPQTLAAHDAFYATHRSMALDFQILMAMLRGDGLGLDACDRAVAAETERKSVSQPSRPE